MWKLKGAVLRELFDFGVVFPKSATVERIITGNSEKIYALDRGDVDASQKVRFGSMPDRPRQESIRFDSPKDVNRSSFMQRIEVHNQRSCVTSENVVTARKIRECG